MSSKNEKPIGVFDSGVGGLTALKKIAEFLPRENLIYFGDTARVPYGNKSNETIIRYSLQIANFLIQQGVKMIVVACNTASSIALEILREKYSEPILGVIEPGVIAALNSTKNNKIGIIGTLSTISNKSYRKALLEKNKELQIYEKACPLFVPLAEEGWLDNEVTYLVAREYLKAFDGSEIDSLILGCTHYPLLKKAISRAIGEQVKLIDTSEEIAKNVKDELEKRNLINVSSNGGKISFFVSDIPQKFIDIAKIFFGEDIAEIKKIDIEKY